MKLRRNVLQPLRLEIHPQRSDAGCPNPADTRERTSISKFLRHSFGSSSEARLLRFASRPQGILKEYSEQRQSSIAGNLFRIANRIHASVDSVVVLSLGNSAFGAKAIAQACGQPFWNHLSRAERGSKPRMFFIDDRGDTDTIQALLYMLGCHRPTTSNFDLDDWALLVLAADESEKCWQLQALLSALYNQVANDESQMRQRLMAVAPLSGSIAKQLSVYGDYDFFASCDEPAPFQCFGPLGLLPATLLGINIMELLAGASWMSQHFYEASPNENLLLRLLHALVPNNESITRPTPLRIWNPGLLAWQDWYRDLRQMSVQSVTASGPFEFSRNASSDSGSSCEINIVVDRPRFDPIGFDDTGNSQDRMLENIEDHLRSNCDRGIATATLRLAELDELHTGQLMQFMLLLSASSKLMGLSPPETVDVRSYAHDDLENFA
jgi:glucose-6-phosphate isomerase